MADAMRRDGNRARATNSVPATAQDGTGASRFDAVIVVTEGTAERPVPAICGWKTAPR